MREKKSLLEYVLSPIGTFQSLYNYHFDRDIKRVSKKREELRRDLGGDDKSWIGQYYESLYDENRINLYAQYEEMIRDPLVSLVIRIFADTCTQPSSESRREESGRVVWCYSRNDDIQKIITKFLDAVETDEISNEIMRAMFYLGDQFELFLAESGVGTIRFDPFDPWLVALSLDEERRIKGYGRADERGGLVSSNDVIPYWEGVHFRMPRWKRTDYYGVRSSVLYPVREYWQELQWVMDKIVIERLWRVPNRLLIALDVGGMSTEEGFEVCEDIRSWLYRDLYFNPAAGELRSMPTAWGGFRDIVLPTGADNNTSISSAPGTTSSGPIEDMEFILKRFFAGMNFPAAAVGFDTGYDATTPLEKQDIGFAKRCMVPQKLFLMGLTRAAMAHLVYLGIDPRRDKNAFILAMTPVSVFQEIERQELLALRADLMSSQLMMGRDNEWNMEFWTRFVMEEYGRMPEPLVDALLKKEENQEDVPEEMPDEELYAGVQKKEEYKRLVESFDRHPKASEALLFLREGASMASSSRVSSVVPDGDSKPTSKANLMESIGFATEQFESKLQSRLKQRRDIRMELYKRSLNAAKPHVTGIQGKR